MYVRSKFVVSISCLLYYSCYNAQFIKHFLVYTTLTG